MADNKLTKVFIKNKRTGKYLIDITANDGHSTKIIGSGLKFHYTEDKLKAKQYEYNHAWGIIMDYGRNKFLIENCD